MRVGARHAEAADAHQCALAKGHGLGRDAQRCPFQLQRGIFAHEVQMTGDGLVPLHHDGLRQTRQPCCGLGVTHVALDRAECHGLGRLTQHLFERTDFDRIAEGRSCTVRLDGPEVIRCCTRIVQCIAHQLSLSGTTRSRESIAPAILIDRRPTEHCENPIVVTLGIREAFQDEDTNAFGAHVAIGIRIKGFAAPIGRQGAHLGEHHGRVRREQQVGAAGERHVTLPTPQGTHREVRSDQRGGTGRVERNGRAREAERVADPTCGNTLKDPGTRIRRLCCRVWISERALRPVREGQPQIDAGSRPLHAADQASILEGFPGDMQQQPLLGVHGQRFTVGDPEGIRVEAIHPLEKPTPRRRHHTRGSGLCVFIQVASQGPTRGRHARHQIALFDQRVPQCRCIDDTTREAQA